MPTGLSLKSLLDLLSFGTNGKLSTSIDHFELGPKLLPSNAEKLLQPNLLSL